MAKALEDRDTGILINGQIVSNLRFADDIDFIADSPQDLQKLTDQVYDTSTRFDLCITEPKHENNDYRKKARRNKNQTR